MQTVLNSHFDFIVGFICGWIFVKSVRVVFNIVDKKLKERQRMKEMIRQAVQTSFHENE